MIQSKARQNQLDRHNIQTQDSQESTRVFQVISNNKKMIQIVIVKVCFEAFFLNSVVAGYFVVVLLSALFCKPFFTYFSCENNTYSHLLYSAEAWTPTWRPGIIWLQKLYLVYIMIGLLPFYYISSCHNYLTFHSLIFPAAAQDRRQGLAVQEESEEETGE